MTADADYLRLAQRIEALRRLVAQIDLGMIDQLHAYARSGTWLGPTADAFLVDLQRVRALVSDAEVVIRATADRLAVEADRIRQEQIRAGVRS